MATGAAAIAPRGQMAWLIGVGGGRWVARYRNKASKPMKLPKAKTYALEMVKGIRPGKLVADPIGRLHPIALGCS